MKESLLSKKVLINLDAVAKGAFIIGISLFLWATGFILYAMVLPHLTNAGFSELGPYGDYVGGTIGTGVAVMNIAAFLVLTYAIGAAQQKNHAQQLELQRLNQEQQLAFQRQAQMFSRREDKLKDLKEKFIELSTVLNSIEAEVLEGKLPEQSASMACSTFTFYLATQFKTLFADASIAERSEKIRKHGRIIQKHSHPEYSDHDRVLDSITAVNHEVISLGSEMEQITYKHLL